MHGALTGEYITVRRLSTGGFRCASCVAVMGWAGWHLAGWCLSWWCLAVDGAVLIVGCEWRHTIGCVLVRRVHGEQSSRCFVVSGGSQSMVWNAVRWLVVGVLIVGCEWGLTIWTQQTRSAAVLCVNIVGCEWQFATNDVESS